MSQFSNYPILEWSSDQCTIWSPGASNSVSAPTVAEALPLAGNPSKVIVALSRRNSFVKTVRLPDIDKAEAATVLKFRISEEFPMPGTELAYDFEFLPDKNLDGRLAVLYAAKSQTIRDIRAELKALGVQIVQIVPVSLGSAQVAKSREGSSVVLDKTHEGFTFDVVSHGHTVYSRLASGELGEAELEAEINRTLSSAKISDAAVIACPKVSYFPASETSAESTLMALGKSSSEITLVLPEELLKKEKDRVQSRKNLAFLMVGLAVVGWAYVTWDRTDGAATIESLTASATARNNGLKKNIKEVESRLESTGLKGTILTNANEPKQALSDAVIHVASYVPKDLWLTSINLERGEPLQVRGTSKTSEALKVFMDGLNSSDRLRDVKLVFSNKAEIGETQVVQFSITGHLIGNFPLLEPDEAANESRRTARR